MFFSRSKKAAPPPEAQERRRSVRHTTVMQVAKLCLAGGREELCLLRDVSPEGMKAEIYIDVASESRIEIELRTGQKLAGRVAWTEGSMMGAIFDERVPMSAVLAHCSFDDRLGKLRSPRLVVDMRAALRIDFEERIVRVGNLSQAGMQITAPSALHAGAPCAVTLPGLAPRPATVRWCREGQAGLMLAEPFDYAEFAEWRRSLAAGA